VFGEARSGSGGDASAAALRSHKAAEDGGLIADGEGRKSGSRKAESGNRPQNDILTFLGETIIMAL
jgi:hypothetical protein